MAIRTSIHPRFLYWKPLYALLCLGLGVWGWYDYSVKIPAQEAAYERHAELSKIRDDLAAKTASGAKLADTEVVEYERVTRELAAFTTAPQKPGAYDRPVQ